MFYHKNILILIHIIIFKHAVDVCHTSYRLMMLAQLNTVTTGGSGAMTSLEILSLLIAALGHDVEHPAVNNGLLIKSKHALAFQHNDKSPLENMHCVVLYETLSTTVDHTWNGKKVETNIFINFTESQWRDARKVILFSILGTDMAHHFDQVKKTQLFNELQSEKIFHYYSGDSHTIECLTGTGKTEFENRLFIIELLLHCSDISNPFKPFDICEKWAHLVVAEFFAQGDKERELGFDRNTTNLYNIQLGFIEFIVAPLISTVIHIFPPLYSIGENMNNNFILWGDKRIEEIPIDSKLSTMTPENKQLEIGKIQDRVKKFKEKMQFLETCKSKTNEAAINKKNKKPKISSMEISNFTLNYTI